MPTLTALENIQIPMFEGPWPPRERRERAERLIEEVGLADRQLSPPRASSPSASASASRSRARSPTTPACSWPTSRPATSTARARTRSSSFFTASATQRQLTLVIVTHSHEVAQAADRRIPMKDGMLQPA